MKIGNIVLLLIVGALFYGIIAGGNNSLKAQEKAACENYQEQFQKNPHFYITEAEKKMCDTLGVDVK